MLVLLITDTSTLLLKKTYLSNSGTHESTADYHDLFNLLRHLEGS